MTLNPLPKLAMRALAVAAGLALVTSVGAGIAYVAPVIGFRAQLTRLDTDRDLWRKSSEDFQRASAGWQASFRSAEDLRAKEGRTALAAQAASAEQCAHRVAVARQSAIAIERIVTQEPVYDSSHCPVRSVVAPDRLREALAAYSGSDRPARP